MSRHAYQCHVRFSDVDVYGHVNNVKYFEYYQEARLAFLMSLGRDTGEKGFSLVVARLDVDYKRPILFRPEPYVVRTRVDGTMVDLAKFPRPTGIKLAQVVKVLSDIDISQRNSVQEGHYSARVPDRRVDYRISFAPAMFCAM